MVLTVVVSPATVYADSEQYEAYEAEDDATATIYGADWFYQTFSTTGAYAIEFVRLKLLRVGSPETLTVSIRGVDDSGQPTGLDLVSTDYTGVGTSSGWYEISFPTAYQLEATTTYAIVVRAVAGDASNYIGWRYDSTGSYSGGNYGSSTNSGVSWSPNTDYDFMFATFGTLVFEIVDAKVFSGYLEDEDWLITVQYLNEYPPYYLQSEDVASLFRLQLKDEDTVVAQVSLPMWGYMPGSIYLSADTVSALEWGKTYNITIIGSFSPYPSDSYVLTANDWLGSDLKRLDTWVFGVADRMGSYYTTSMIVYANNQKVLNDAGAVFFSIGIPMLAATRPNIFQNPSLWTTYSENEWARAYEKEMLQFREAVGDTIADDADAVGDLFNLTGNQAVAAALTGGWIVTAVSLASVVGPAALVITIPFALIGVVAKVLPMTLFAIVGALFVMAFVLHTWFNR